MLRIRLHTAWLGRGCGAVALALLLVPPAARAEVYIVTDLGLWGVGAGPFAIGASGHVAGATIPSDTGMRAVLWDGGASFVEPAAGEQHSFGFALSDFDAVAAVSYDMGGTIPHGLLWQGGQTTELGPLAPRGMNNAGVVVGCLTSNDPAFGLIEHAARWVAGVTTDLGTLGGHFSYAYDINEIGWIVGVSRVTGDLTERPCLWVNGVPRDLGTLGGAQGQAYGINEMNEVVGWAHTAGGLPHAFLYRLDAGGNVVGRVDLGALGGSTSFARGINNAGEVVGVSNAAAVRWTGGAISDLNTLIPVGTGWKLDVAWAISDSGQIVGVGTRAGQPASFLLTPALIADMNCDGHVDFFDIDPFLTALLDPDGYPIAYPGCSLALADVNRDGHVDFFDIDPFLECLFAGGCP